MRHEFDVLVLGGGVAGGVAALRLVASGRTVAVVGSPRRPAIEGFSPRVATALAQAGCEQAMRALQGPVERRVTWAGKSSAANVEYVVDRTRFDEGIALDAQRAGVTVLTGRIVTVVRVDDGWAVSVTTPDGPLRHLRCRILIEARGRAAPRAKASVVKGPATLAVTRFWHTVRPRPPFTAVTSLSSGWAWFASTGTGTAAFTVLTCGRQDAVSSRQQLDRFLADRLAEVPETSAWLEGYRPYDGVSARSASATLTRPVIEDGLIRLGDAAYAIDPLSGHGCYEALRAAFTAPALVNTLMDDPPARALARQFHVDRCEEAFFRHARTGREFYDLETQWTDQPFWSDRRAWPDERPAHAALSAEASVQVRPVIENDRIVAREVIVTPDHPLGVWRVNGVSVVPLIKREGPPPFTPEMAAAVGWLKQRRLMDQPPAA